MSRGTTFNVGGSGGTQQYTGDQWNRGATIAFRTGSWIDAIIINGTQYGGNGGSVTVSNIPIPVGGTITLMEAKVSTNSNSNGALAYLHFIVNGQDVKVGNAQGGTSVFSSPGVGVSITEVQYGTYLNSITFQYV